MVSEELMVLMVCKEMRWTYTEYMAQPAWFVGAVREMLQIEAKDQEKKAKKQKSPKK